TSSGHLLPEGEELSRLASFPPSASAQGFTPARCRLRKRTLFVQPLGPWPEAILDNCARTDSRLRRRRCLRPSAFALGASAHCLLNGEGSFIAACYRLLGRHGATGYSSPVFRLPHSPDRR